MFSYNSKSSNDQFLLTEKRRDPTQRVQTVYIMVKCNRTERGFGDNNTVVHVERISTSKRIITTPLQPPY